MSQILHGTVYIIHTHAFVVESSNPMSGEPIFLFKISYNKL